MLLVDVELRAGETPGICEFDGGGGGSGGGGMAGAPSSGRTIEAWDCSNGVSGSNKGTGGRPWPASLLLPGLGACGVE